MRVAPVGLVFLVSSACGPVKTSGTTAGTSTEGGPGSTSQGATSSTTGRPDLPPPEPIPDVPSGCEEFAGDPPGPPVTVTIRNARDTAIFVENLSGCDTKWISIRDPQGESVPWIWDSWTPSCATLTVPNSASCGGGDCAGAAVHLEPGQSMTEVWPGEVFQRTRISDACWGGDDWCGLDCVIPRAPDPATYTIGAVAAFGLDCGGMSCPSCDPVPAEFCVLRFDFGQALTPDRIETAGTLNYPTETSIELVFE